MRHYVYVPLTEERRFLVFVMDSESGKLSLSQEIELAAQPWQLCMDPSQRYLYQQVRDEGYSGVASFRIDPGTGGVTQIGEVELEAAACYVSTDMTGRFLLASHLLSGMVTVHPIGDDGVAHGPAVDKQVTELYAHYVATDPSNRYAFVPHVAPTDAIYQFLCSEDTGRLTPNAMPKIDTDPGRGPRHLAFHPSLDVVYANDEQASSVTVYRLDTATGTLEAVQTLSTLPDEGFEGENSNATVRVHPTGKAVYVSNRGHDSITTFSIDPNTGLISSLGHVPAEEFPRPFAIEPDGDFLFAGSDHTGRLSSYRIDAQGILNPLEVYEVGMWVSWVLPVKLA